MMQQPQERERQEQLRKRQAQVWKLGEPGQWQREARQSLQEKTGRRRWRDDEKH